MYAWVPGSLDSASRLVDQALEIVGEGALLLATQGQIRQTYVNLMIHPEERYLDRALDLATQSLAIELAGPTSPLHIYAGWILASAGLRDEAMDLLELASSDLVGSVNGPWASFLFHALAGNAERASVVVSSTTRSSRPTIRS